MCIGEFSQPAQLWAGGVTWVTGERRRIAWQPRLAKLWQRYRLGVSHGAPRSVHFGWVYGSGRVLGAAVRTAWLPVAISTLWMYASFYLGI